MNYKGYEIEKFNQGEGKWVPNHVIKEYYQSEKDNIDRLIKKEKTKCEMTKTVDECFDDFLNEMNN